MFLVKKCLNYLVTSSSHTFFFPLGLTLNHSAEKTSGKIATKLGSSYVNLNKYQNSRKVNVIFRPYA